MQRFRPSDETKGVKLQWCRSPTSKGKTYEEWLSDQPTETQQKNDGSSVV